MLPSSAWCPTHQDVAVLVSNAHPPSQELSHYNQGVRQLEAAVTSVPTVGGCAPLSLVRWFHSESERVRLKRVRVRVKGSELC